MKNKLLVSSFLAFSLSTQLSAASLEPALVKSATLDEGKTAIEVNMNVEPNAAPYYEYAIIRVAAAAKSKIKAKVVEETLAYCKIIAVNDAYLAKDVMIAFEPENDGGYNSCKISLTDSVLKTVREVTISADVGE